MFGIRVGVCLTLEIIVFVLGGSLSGASFFSTESFSSKRLISLSIRSASEKFFEEIAFCISFCFSLIRFWSSTIVGKSSRSFISWSMTFSRFSAFLNFLFLIASPCKACVAVISLSKAARESKVIVSPSILVTEGFVCSGSAFTMLSSFSRSDCTFFSSLSISTLSFSAFEKSFCETASSKLCIASLSCSSSSPREGKNFRSCSRSSTTI